jgi:hypothetical protein
LVLEPVAASVRAAAGRVDEELAGTARAESAAALVATVQEAADRAKRR